MNVMRAALHENFLKHRRDSCVEAGMIFESRWGIRGGAVVVMLALFCAPLVRGAESAGTAEPPPRDALVYKDGDRVQGKFVERTDDIIVFKADRFGELRVPAADAVVVLAEKS